MQQFPLRTLATGESHASLSIREVYAQYGNSSPGGTASIKLLSKSWRTKAATSLAAADGLREKTAATSVSMRTTAPSISQEALNSFRGQHQLGMCLL